MTTTTGPLPQRRHDDVAGDGPAAALPGGLDLVSDRVRAPDSRRPGRMTVPALVAAPVPPGAWDARRWARDPRVLAGLTALALEALYLVFQPQSPDLAAQLARAAAASRGAGLWWAGWYGGVNTPPYSLLSGALMAHYGVLTLGVLSTAVVCVLGADLMRGTVRPRIGAVAISAVACANLAQGRLTFAAGMAPALASLVLLRRGRPRTAAACAAVSGLISPLAAFTALTALAVMFLVGQPRRPLVLIGVAAALPVGVVSLLFGQPSTMPFNAFACLGVVIASVAVTVLPVPTIVRVTGAVAGVVAVLAWAVPSPIGVNAIRVPLLVFAPLVLATVRRDGPFVRFAMVGLMVWPVLNLVMELHIGADSSSQAAYYAPLLRQLPEAGTAVQRLELVDTRTHGGAFHLSGRVPLARGWERQVDVAQNGLFYEGELTAQEYRDWLRARAVGWVALPSAEPDYGARREADLVRAGLPYLTPQWHNADWTLYRVTVDAPAATGGVEVTALQDAAVQLRSDAAATGVVKLAYSRLLTVRNTDDPLVRGCVARGPDGNVLVTVPSAGRWTITADVGQLLNDCGRGPDRLGRLVSQYR